MSLSPTMSYNDPSYYSNQMYGRQESSASMDLGNAYTDEMKDMLETPIDISNYLIDEDFEPLDGRDQPTETPQPSEKMQTQQYYQQQLQLQHALYYDYDMPEQQTSYGSDYSPNYDSRNVKTEPDEEEYLKYEKETTPAPSTSLGSLIGTSSRTVKKTDAAKALANYKPLTKARGYKIKEEEEKEDPCYKLKRARNNDAVRKSRTKAKEQQMERDKELNHYKDRCILLEKEVKSLKMRLARFEK